MVFIKYSEGKITEVIEKDEITDDKVKEIKKTLKEYEDIHNSEGGKSKEKSN